MQSLVLAVLEAGLVVGLSVWLLDVFRRRYDRQGPITHTLGRAAYVRRAALLVRVPGVSRIV